jgi:hypothetical protein
LFSICWLDGARSPDRAARRYEQRNCSQSSGLLRFVSVPSVSRL